MVKEKEQEARKSDPLNGMTTLTKVTLQQPRKLAWQSSSRFVLSRTILATLVLAGVLGVMIGNFFLQMTTSKPKVVPALESQVAIDGVGIQDATTSEIVCAKPQFDTKLVSKELNLLVWTEYVPADWITCFEQIYNIKVNRTEFSSNDEMLEMLASGEVTYDLIQPSDLIMNHLIEDGLLQKLDKNKLTILNNLNPTFLDQVFDPGNEYSLPYQAGSYSLAVNKDKVSKLPTLWKDLWNSDYAGQMVLMDDARVMIGVTLLAMGFDINTTDKAEIGLTQQRLVTLIKNAKQVDSDNQSASILAGEINLGVFWNGEAFLAQRENPSIELVYPNEGTILWQDNYALGAKAQHTDAAYAWLNYTMQGDMFWLMLRDFPYTNPNKAALTYAKEFESELYDAYMNSTITNVPSNVMLTGHWLESNRELQPIYEQVWKEAKVAAGILTQ